MNSIDSLYDAVSKLADYDGHGVLMDAREGAYNLSQLFSNVNGGLCQGWATTADFTLKIDDMVREQLTELHDVLYKFVTETKTDEGKAEKAAEEANDAAQDILGSL